MVSLRGSTVRATVGRGLTLILMVSPFALLTQLLPSLILSTQKRWIVGALAPTGANSVLLKVIGRVPLVRVNELSACEALSLCSVALHDGVPDNWRVKVTVVPEQMVSSFTDRLLLGDGLITRVKIVSGPTQFVGKGPVGLNLYLITPLVVSLLVTAVLTMGPVPLTTKPVRLPVTDSVSQATVVVPKVRLLFGVNVKLPPEHIVSLSTALVILGRGNTNTSISVLSPAQPDGPVAATR
jgi:hypothetical protein